MAEPLVIHDDLVEFLTGWYRAWLAGRPEAICQGVTVTNIEPDTIPAKLLVIRDDGGPHLSVASAERVVSFSTLAGSKANPKPAMDLMRFVVAALNQIPSAVASNPVAAVTEVNGPYFVPDEQPQARTYANATLVVVPRVL